MKFPRNPFIHSLALSLLAVSSAHSADATWNGTTNATWSTGTNWSAATPGTGNTATFNGAGNANTTISLNAITVGNIRFDTASAAAYTLGSGAVGSQSFSLNDAGALTVNSTVTTNQRINADLILGTTAVGASYGFTNNSSTTGQLLTIAGKVGSNQANATRTKTLTLGGSGNGLVSGIISGNGSGNGSNETATVALTKSGTGLWTLSGANTYSGLTTVTTGTLLANNLAGSATGTGAVSVAINGILGGSGTITPGSSNGINVTGVLAPGADVATIGNLTLDLGSTTGTVVMNSGASFKYDLGAAGADINTIGTSDLLTLAGAAANDFAFTNNSVDFLGTGGVGYYKLFDTSSNLATTWTGLTVSGTGLITSGLTVSNLGSGLSGSLIMGGNSLGGTAGDIYLQVVPEPSVALLGGAGALLLLRRRRVS